MHGLLGLVNPLTDLRRWVVPRLSRLQGTLDGQWAENILSSVPLSWFAYIFMYSAHSFLFHSTFSYFPRSLLQYVDFMRNLDSVIVSGTSFTVVPPPFVLSPSRQPPPTSLSPHGPLWPSNFNLIIQLSTPRTTLPKHLRPSLSSVTPQSTKLRLGFLEGVKEAARVSSHIVHRAYSPRGTSARSVLEM